MIFKGELTMGKMELEVKVLIIYASLDTRK